MASILYMKALKHSLKKLFEVSNCSLFSIFNSLWQLSERFQHDGGKSPSYSKAVKNFLFAQLDSRVQKDEVSGSVLKSSIIQWVMRSRKTFPLIQSWPVEAIQSSRLFFFSPLSRLQHLPLNQHSTQWKLHPGPAEGIKSKFQRAKIVVKQQSVKKKKNIEENWR